MAPIALHMCCNKGDVTITNSGECHQVADEIYTLHDSLSIAENNVPDSKEYKLNRHFLFQNQ